MANSYFELWFDTGNPSGDTVYKFRSLFVNWRGKDRIRAQSMNRDSEGKLDLVLGAITGTVSIIARVKDVETEPGYGSYQDLENLYMQYTSTSKLMYRGNDGASYEVAFYPRLSPETVTPVTTGEHAFFHVPLQLEIVEPL